MANKFVTERAAAEEFFKNANPQDDILSVTFADRPRLLDTSIESIEDMQETLTSDPPDGHTALLDAIYLAIAHMRSARYQRRALVIISDGADNHSRYGLKDVRKLVEEANVDVYAIGIFDSLFFRSFEEFMGRRWLAEITDVTGGRTVAAARLDKVPEIAAAVSRQMRNQYVLGYRPQNISRDGKWRKIKVHVVPSAGRATGADTLQKRLPGCFEIRRDPAGPRHPHPASVGPGFFLVPIRRHPERPSGGEGSGVKPMPPFALAMVPIHARSLRLRSGQALRD